MHPLLPALAFALAALCGHPLCWLLAAPAFAGIVLATEPEALRPRRI